MSKVENILILEEELEDLRERLNADIVKEEVFESKEEYRRSLLTVSRKLDDVIVKYIKSSN